MRFEHREQFLKFTDMKLLALRGACPDSRNERGYGGGEGWFMLLDASGGLSGWTVIHYGSIFQMQICDLC